MPSNKPELSITVSHEQLAALHDLKDALGEKSIAAITRRLYADACRAAGIDWPDEPLVWGRRPKDA